MQEDQMPTALLEGWYKTENGQAHLLGSCCVECGTYYFPAQTFYCRNPVCDSSSLKEVLLSRTGTLWSYSKQCYPPPPPYVYSEPFVPYTIGAVMLEREKIIILGQIFQENAKDLTLKTGQPMELVFDNLLAINNTQRSVWKWRQL